MKEKKRCIRVAIAPPPPLCFFNSRYFSSSSSSSQSPSSFLKILRVVLVFLFFSRHLSIPSATPFLVLPGCGALLRILWLFLLRFILPLQRPRLLCRR